MKMTMNWTRLFQGLAIAIQLLVPEIPGFPKEWASFFHALVAVLQGWQALIAQASPPPQPADAAKEWEA